MRKFIVFGVIGIMFAISLSASGFELKIKRDPFMDLLKYGELKVKEIKLHKKLQESVEEYLNREGEIIKSSLRVKMIVTSRKDPKAKAALLFGPSMVPIVVMEGYKLKDGVYVKDINNNGVEIEIKRGNHHKTIVLKISK
ncbi:hypothetical protein [Hippea alviniae]|uniref:hypothetical protein n=1 Tax=Hippea alviniae TaxID=1279027 RepID=UPI0003B7722D|nr:hypothetical protein [Hippea alviniae]